MSLVVFDLDGTLAPVGLPIPEDIADGMRALENAGHQIAVCSGKPFAYLCGMLRQTGLRKPAMAGENGAAVQLGWICHPFCTAYFHIRKARGYRWQGCAV